jgi:hypothetical protein
VDGEEARAKIWPKWDGKVSKRKTLPRLPKGAKEGASKDGRKNEEKELEGPRANKLINRKEDNGSPK